MDVSPSGSRSGTLCRRRVNECSVPKQYDVDCDPNAVRDFLKNFFNIYFRTVLTLMKVLSVVVDQDLLIFLNNLINYQVILHILR